jgi:hypothetical protein
MPLLDIFFFSTIIFIIFYFNRVGIFNSSTLSLIVIYVLPFDENLLLSQRNPLLLDSIAIIY